MFMDINTRLIIVPKIAALLLYEIHSSGIIRR